jgi:hypothetical protein
MKLPKQSVPIQRNTIGAAISNEKGVEASFLPLLGGLLAKVFT